MQNDPYEILGVGKNATPEEINSAFKEKAKQAHPDQGGSADKFTRVKEASLILLDPKKRSRFDKDGFIGTDKVDNDVSIAMQRIVSFFISSIDATLDAVNRLDLSQLDLVQGAQIYFSQQSDQHKMNVLRIEGQIKQYEKAISRLKTKRKNDVIRGMLNNHMLELKQKIEGSNEDIRVCAEAKKILMDYSFEEPQSPYTMLVRGIFRP